MGFHEGEIAVQERAGVRAAGARLEGAVHDALTPGAARFLGEASTVGISALGPDGHLWASVWCGPRGVLSAAEDLRRIAIRRAAVSIAAGDPVVAHLRPGARVGVLAIDLSTRRRIRVNGTVVSDVGAEWTVRVDEAFGNCPKYIQRRHVLADGTDAPATLPPARGVTLGADERALIARADTAFVASEHPDRGLDASHRGGPRGFIGIEHDRSILVPDYPGNNMFTTLGNFAVSPRAGLAIVDFEGSRCLSLTGRAAIVHDLADVDGTAGTQRGWRMTIDEWVAFDLDRRARWTLVEESPFNPQRRLQIDQQRDA